MLVDNGLDGEPVVLAGLWEKIKYESWQYLLPQGGLDVLEIIKIENYETQHRFKSGEIQTGLATSLRAPPPSVVGPGQVQRIRLQGHFQVGGESRQTDVEPKGCPGGGATALGGIGWRILAKRGGWTSLQWSQAGWRRDTKPSNLFLKQSLCDKQGRSHLKVRAWALGKRSMLWIIIDGGELQKYRGV